MIKEEEDIRGSEVETDTSNDLVACENCEKECKELNDDNLCGDCVKAEALKIEKFGYKLVMVYLDEDLDDYEITRISRIDALSCYEIIKNGLFEGKDYIELPEMESMDEDDDEAISNPETMFIGNRSVSKVYYEKMEDE